MTYCAGCRNSVDKESLGGSVIGDTWTDFIRKLLVRQEVKLYFCRRCWKELQDIGVVPR